jgi:hypothetical protein
MQLQLEHGEDVVLVHVAVGVAGQVSQTQADEALQGSVHMPRPLRSRTELARSAFGPAARSAFDPPARSRISPPSPPGAVLLHPSTSTTKSRLRIGED